LIWVATDTTTIAFVPIAARIVVLIVANAISDIILQPAFALDILCAGIRFRCERAVSALALLAVFVVIGSTTVSSIPSASSIVVIVITRFVSFPGRLATRPFHCLDALVALRYVLAIQTLAFLAVLELIALATGTTAIAFIPATSGIIVVVVAEAIPNEVLGATTTLDFLRTFVAFMLVFAVFTRALFAVFIVVIVPAAIPSIPAATGVVVVIVTSLVSLPGWFPTGFFHFGNACVAFRFVVAVFAFAFFTELKSFCTTTVTGVPIASTVIVVVIAISIANVLSSATFAFAPNLSTSISFVGDVVGVQTFAANNLSSLVFCLRVAIFQGAFGGPATVASVPVAAAIVVIVVTIAVTFPLHISTFRLACFRRWGGKTRVPAFALFAPFVGVFGSAAITLVPSTLAVIIAVVAICITRPRRLVTLAFVRACAFAATYTALIFLCNALFLAVVEF